MSFAEDKFSNQQHCEIQEGARQRNKGAAKGQRDRKEAKGQKRDKVTGGWRNGGGGMKKSVEEKLDFR